MTNFRTRYDFFGSIVITIVIVLGSIWVSCSKEEINPRLASITEIVSSSPQEALDSLKAIDKDCLSESDRYYYDFLTVKASDKAFIRHQSSNQIQNIISFYERSNNLSLKAEVYYYGGRVYKDLGDYPSALSFFQKALETIPNDEANRSLCGNICNQISGLYNRLRLFDDAEEYLAKAISVDIESKDTLNLIVDLETLGNLKLNTKKLGEAEKILQTALNLSESRSGIRRHNLIMHIAGIKHKMGHNDSALLRIRNIPEFLKKTNARYTALSYASEIYLKAGILDTAFNYAHQLAYSNSRNKRNGFHVLLSPELRCIVPTDSLIKYANDYSVAVEQYLNQNEAEEVAIQTSIYNYDAHLQSMHKTEERNTILLKFISIITIITLSIIIVFLWRENFYQKKKMQLHTAIENSRKLRDILSEKGIIIDEETYEEIGTSDTRSHPTILKADSILEKIKSDEELRIEYRTTLLSIVQNSGSPKSVPLEIIESDTYKKLKLHTDGNIGLNDDHPLFDELEKMVARYFPNFKSSLIFLTNGNITKSEINVSLLVKCGFTPSEMAKLLNKTISTIGSRRESIAYKIYGEKMSVKTIDAIMRLL